MPSSARIGLLTAGVRSTLATSGVELVPVALRAVGAVGYASRLEGVEFRDFGDVTIPPAGTEDYADPSGRVKNLWRLHESLLPIAQAVSGVVREGFVPIVVGGDSVTVLGVLAGLHDAGAGRTRLGLLFLDGYAEFHTAATSTSGDASGMTLALATGRGDLSLARIARERFPLVEETDVLALGARSIEPAEAEALARSRITLVPLAQLRGPGGGAPFMSALGRLTQRVPDVLAHVDASVLDPSRFPVVAGSPPSGGLAPEQLRRIGNELTAWRHAGTLRLRGVVLAGVDPRKEPGGFRLRELWEFGVRLLV